MRRVGAILVVLACAGLQLPWFTCHSDCRDACLPVWDLAAHHCHDEHAEDHHGHHCLAHCHADGAKGGEDPDHGPGDHDLQLHASRRPASFEGIVPDAASLAVALPASADPTGTRLAGAAAVVARALDAGPPGRIATVRLLL